MNDHPPLASVTISLNAIYNVLCPKCRTRLIDQITAKAGFEMLREGLRVQLEASAHPEPVEGAPDVGR